MEIREFRAKNKGGCIFFAGFCLTKQPRFSKMGVRLLIIFLLLSNIWEGAACLSLPLLHFRQKRKASGFFAGFCLTCNRCFVIVFPGIFSFFCLLSPRKGAACLLVQTPCLSRDKRPFFLVDFGNAGGIIFLPNRGILLLLFGAACGKMPALLRSLQS